MRTKDLAPGDTVYVRLPYEGGLGDATVLAIEPPRVRIRFLPGQGPSFKREFLVLPDRIWRKVQA